MKSNKKPLKDTWVPKKSGTKLLVAFVIIVLGAVAIASYQTDLFKATFELGGRTQEQTQSQYEEALNQAKNNAQSDHLNEEYIRQVIEILERN